MLTVEGAWEQLSVEERLFLLAVAFELPKISGLSVHASDVADNSGFSFGDLMRVARSLKDKTLLSGYLDHSGFNFVETQPQSLLQLGNLNHLRKSKKDKNSLQN